jgi:septation ring formation regulator EzrA
VQRIPRYELYIKDFLKCTNLNHPDYQLLLKAQLEIHSLAEQIDKVQEEVGSTDLNLTNNSLELVQDMIEDLTDVCRSFYLKRKSILVCFYFS